MLVVLEAVAGPIAGRRIEVRSGSILRLGRTARSDYAIGEDSYLSGQHFAVECDGIQCRIRDLGSSNGTFVNGNRITEAVVHEGDSLTAGESTFTIHVDAAAAAAAPAIPAARTATVPTLGYDAPHTRLDKTAAAPLLSKTPWGGFSRSQSALLQALYRTAEAVFAVLDASRDSRIPAFLEASGAPYQTLEVDKRIVAYLVSLPQHAKLLDVLIKDGWGHGWGFYLTSGATLEQLAEHWRRYLILYTADGHPLTFRFWDPRMLRALAPVMTPQECATFFGPVTRMIVESEKPEIAIEISPTSRGGRQHSLMLV